MEIDIKKHLTFPVFLICFLLIISLIFIFPALKMIVLGAILAYLIKPIAFKIQSKLKYSSVSIIIAMITVIIPLIVLVGYISYELYSVASTIITSGSILDINQFISQCINYLHINVNPNELSQSVTSSFETIISYVMNYSVSIVSKFANLSLDLFILVCSVFYFVRDGDKCLKFIKSFIPDDSINFFDKTIEDIKNVLRSIFYGHFLTAIIIGIFGCIGYSILGYPFGAFLGVLTGILQLIPIFGPWPIYWTLFFIDVISGNYPRAVVVLLFGFFLSGVDMYIRPALSSHYADIHPLILLVGFLAGPLVYGIVGFIAGPLILGITYTVLDSYRKEYLMGDE